MLSKPDFNKDLLKNKEQFKEAYLKKNVEDIIKETLGEKHVNAESINYIYEQLKNIDNNILKIVTDKIYIFVLFCSLSSLFVLYASEVASYPICSESQGRLSVRRGR